MRDPRCCAVVLCLLRCLAGCGPEETGSVRGVVRDGRTGSPVAGAVLRALDVSGVTVGEDGRFELRAPLGAGQTLSATADGYCPRDQRVDVRREGTGGVTVHLFRRLEIDESHLQVGFDREVELRARTRCDADARVRWRRLFGPELPPERMRIEDGGRRAVLRTPPLSEVVELDSRLGVIPLSRVQRVDLRFEVEAEVGGRVETRTVRVTAAAPGAGVFQVPSGHDVYLNGGDGDEHRWELTGFPDGSEAELLDPNTRTPRFRPDRFGQYLLEHQPSGTLVAIMAGPFEDVPRDCGRSNCHRPEDEGWQTTAHARAFRRGVEGELGPAFGRACWSCHATGVDEGVANGGLQVTAARIGFVPPVPHVGAWESLPRAIRRHGSVWCSACHGPGRILPPPFTWEYGAKYQAGVCAQCHDVTDDPDAPHDSPHVREWALAPMSHFVAGLGEDDPALREGCAPCHSAQGFIEWARHGRSTVPARETVAAVSCTTCHDPHSGANPSGLRVYGDVPDVAGAPATGQGSGAMCMSCHRTGVAREGDDSMAPHAPQSEMLLGRGSRLLVRAEIPAGPHAALATGCVACHMARPPEDDPLRGRAGGHTFSVRDLTATRSPRPLLNRHACAGCHAEGVPPHAIGGIEDRDGDGRANEIGEEFSQALAAARAMARERIARAGIADRCATAREAADFVERDARLVLTTADGQLLGDCDGDGRFTEREREVGIEQISRAVRYALYDISLLEKDGSQGRHNPTFAFLLLRAIRDALD